MKYLIFLVLLLTVGAVHAETADDSAAMYACIALPASLQSECTRRIAAYLFAPLPHGKAQSPEEKNLDNVIFKALKDASDKQSPKQWFPVMAIQPDGTWVVAIYYLDPGVVVLPGSR